MGLAACPVGVGMGEVRFFMALLILSVADFYDMPDNRESWESWESMGRKTPKDDGEVFTQKIDQKKNSSGLKGFFTEFATTHVFFWTVSSINHQSPTESNYRTKTVLIWMFPKIMVPPNHPF